jgi:amino acid adenylation domain-containing protein
MRIEHLVARWVAARPDACAVREHTTGRAVSYRALWQRSGQVAAVLAARGVGRGDVVVVALDRSIELVQAILGVVRTGAAYVLLDPVSPPARNAMIVEEVRAAALVEAAQPAPWCPATAVPQIAVPLDDGAGGEVPELDPTADQDVAYVAYTSGSTGRPKGVLTSHRAVAHFVADSALVTLGPDDTVASLANPASDATTFELWKPLTAGASVVVLPAVGELGAEDWQPLLEREAVTVMFVMAGLLDLLSRAEPATFSALDTVVFGGEALDPGAVLRVCRHRPPRRLVLGYGPTETTVFATAFVCTPESVGTCDRIPLGSALDGYSLTVIGDDGTEVRPGEVGELCIGGPGVAEGYLARPELTEARFVRRPDGSRFYRTGDRVRALPDRDLEFVGRLDRQVKIRGYRVELEEVERAVLATGAVRAAAVDRAEGSTSAHLVCFYVPLGPDTGGAVGLSAAVAEQLPGYMIPARWIAVPELPRTGIGKVDRAALRRRDLPVAVPAPEAGR